MNSWYDQNGQNNRKVVTCTRVCRFLVFLVHGLYVVFSAHVLGGGVIGVASFITTDEQLQ